MSKNIRCIRNCNLDVMRDGEEISEQFFFGRWYAAKLVEVINPEYINVYLEDGGVISGIQRSIFEIGLAPIIELEQPVEAEEVADTQLIDLEEIRDYGNEFSDDDPGMSY